MKRILSAVLLALVLPLAARAELATLLNNNFETAGSSTTASTKPTAITDSSNVGWYRNYARLLKTGIKNYPYVTSLGVLFPTASATSANTAGNTGYLASAPFSGNAGVLTFKAAVGTGSATPSGDVKLHFFFGPSAEPVQIPSAGFPGSLTSEYEYLGEITLASDSSSTNTYQTYMFNIGRENVENKRLYIARVGTSVYDIVLDDILLMEKVSFVACAEELHLVGGGTQVLSNSKVTPEIKLVQDGTVTDFALTLKFKRTDQAVTTGDGYETRTLSLVSSGGGTNTYRTAGSLDAPTASGEQMEMFALCTYTNEEGPQSVEFVYTSENPFRVDTTPRDRGKGDLVVNGAFGGAPLVPVADNVKAGVYVRENGLSGDDAFAFEFANGDTYGRVNTEIPFENTIRGGEAFNAPVSLTRDVFFEYSDAESFICSVQYGDVQTFESWDATQAHGWSASANAAVVESDAVDGTHSLLLQPGDSLLLTREQVGVREAGFWFRRAPGVEGAVTVNLERSLDGTSFSAVAVYTSRPTDLWKYVRKAMGDSQMSVRAIRLTVPASSAGAVLVDSVFATDCSRASVGSIVIDPAPVQQGVRSDLTATFVLEGGAQLDNVTFHWGQGPTAASVTNEFRLLAGTESGTYVSHDAGNIFVDNADNDIFYYVTADCTGWDGKAMSPLSSATTTIAVVPYSGLASMVVHHTGAADIPMSLASSGLWKGVLYNASNLVNPEFQYEDSNGRKMGDASVDTPSTSGFVADNETFAIPGTVSKSLAFQYDEADGTNSAYRIQLATVETFDGANYHGWSRSAGTITLTDDRASFAANTEITSPDNLGGAGAVSFWAGAASAGANAQYTITYKLQNENTWRTAGTGTIAGTQFRYHEAVIGNPHVQQVKIKITGNTAILDDLVITVSGAYVELSAAQIATNQQTFVTSTAVGENHVIPYGNSPAIRVTALPNVAARDVRVYVEFAYASNPDNIFRLEMSPVSDDVYSVVMPPMGAGLMNYRFVSEFGGEDAQPVTYPTDTWYQYLTDDDLPENRIPNIAGMTHDNTYKNTIYNGWNFKAAYASRTHQTEIGFSAELETRPTTAATTSSLNGIGRIYFKARSVQDYMEEHCLAVELSSDGTTWSTVQEMAIPTSDTFTQFCLELNIYEPRYVRIVRTTEGNPENMIYFKDLVVTPPPANITFTQPSIFSPGYPSREDDITFYADVRNVNAEFPAANYDVRLNWRVSKGAWRSTPMTNASAPGGDGLYTVTLPALAQGKVEYYMGVTFNGASYAYQYDPTLPLQFFAEDSYDAVEEDPRNGNESHTPSYLVSDVVNPDQFYQGCRQVALDRPGEYDGLYRWFRIRMFDSHHKQLEFVYTNLLEYADLELDEGDPVPDFHAETATLELVGDETWLCTFSVSNSVHIVGDIFGINSYDPTEPEDYDYAKDLWGEADQDTFIPPFSGVLEALESTPVDIQLSTPEPVFLMLRMNVLTGEYQVRQAAYQNFNTWQADEKSFEDSTGLYNVERYEEDFESARFVETVPTVITEPFDNGPETGLEAMWFSTFGWRLGNGWVLRERRPRDTSDRDPMNGNYAVVLQQPGGTVQTDPGSAITEEGLESVSFRHRVSYGADDYKAYYKKGFGWKDYTFSVSNLTVASQTMSAGYPYVSVIANYVDLENYVELRLTQLQNATSSGGAQQDVAMNLYKVVGGVETLLSGKYATKNNYKETDVLNPNGNASTNRFTNCQLDQGQWKVTLSVTNNIIDAMVVAPNLAWAGRLQVSGQIAGTPLADGGTVALNVFDAPATFQRMGVRAANNSLLLDADNAAADWYLWGNQKGTTNKPRWTSNDTGKSLGLTRPVPSVPFSVGYIRCGASGSYPSGTAFTQFGTGTSSLLSYGSFSQQAHFWDNTIIQVKPLASDGRLVVDDLETRSWHGRDLPEGIRGYDRQTSNTTWRATEAVVSTYNHSRVVELTTSRANPLRDQMIISPEMLNGIGTVVFNYYVTGGRVTFLVERNAVSGSYADTDDFVQVGDPITVSSGDSGQIFRAIRQNMTGRVRVRIDRTNSDPDATVYIDNILAKSYPPDDGRSWKAYNALIVAPERNVMTDSRQFDEDPETQTAFLNNSETKDTIQGTVFDEYDPFIQSPYIRTGIGEIGFWYRAWDATDPNPGRITLQIAPSVNAEESEWITLTPEGLDRSDEAIYQANKAALESLENITDTAFQYFQMEICDYTNYVLRICSSTHGAQRVAIDNVIVTEPVRASIDIGSIEMDPRIPLGHEPVGIEVQLQNPRMNPTNIHVYVDYYIGTNVWGVANWGADERLYEHMELFPDEEDPYLFRTSEFTKIPGQPVDAVVQYRVRVTYEGRFASPVIDTRFENPSWYEPVDLNKTYADQGESPYYFVFSCPTGCVFFNEFYPSDGGNNSDREFVEIMGPQNASLGGWYLDVVDAEESANEDFVMQTIRIRPDAVFGNISTNGWGFYVLGDESDRLEGVDQYFPGDPVEDTLPTSGGLRLRRSMGAYVDRVSWGSGNGPAKNEMVDRGYTYTINRSSSYKNRAFARLSKIVDDVEVFDWSTLIGQTSWTVGMMNNDTVQDLIGPCPYTFDPPTDDAMVDPKVAYFDRYSGSEGYKDLEFNLTLKEHTLSAVYLGDELLVDGEDYEDLGELVLLYKECLGRCTNGEWAVTFEMDGGENPVAVVTVTDSNPGGEVSDNLTVRITGYEMTSENMTFTVSIVNNAPEKTVSGLKAKVIGATSLIFTDPPEWSDDTEYPLSDEQETYIIVTGPAEDVDANFFKVLVQ